MTKGVRVAKPGVDALSADIKDLLYTTEAPSLKLFNFGTVSFVASTSGPTVTLTHVLGYVPAYRIFVETVPDSGKWFVDTNLEDNIDLLSTPIAARFVTSATSSTVRVVLGGLTVGLRYRFRFYIFRDRVV